MVTLDMIAEKTGVSKSTVSRALSENSDLISEKTREKIQAEAYKMGYFDKTLDLVERLRGPVMRNIGISVDDLSNPFFTAFLKGAISTAALRNYRVIIMEANGDVATEHKNVQNFKRLNVTGMIIHTVASDTPFRVREIDDQIPKVFFGYKCKARDVDYVGVDTRSAMRKMGEYLLQLGHRSIALVGASDKFSDRMDGYREALEGFGLAFDKKDVVYCEASRFGGYNAMRELLARQKRYTAIMCTCDFVALGVIEYLQRHGKQVPEDYSVTGLDNIDMASQYGTELTTIAQPAFEMGREAVKILLEKIENHATTCEQRILEYNFVMRKTCRELPRTGRE